jgi:hypothetical protein
MPHLPDGTLRHLAGAVNGQASVPPIAAPSGLTYRHSPDLEEVP